VLAACLRKADKAHTLKLPNHTSMECDNHRGTSTDTCTDTDRGGEERGGEEQPGSHSSVALHKAALCLLHMNGCVCTHSSLPPPH
jgi:hypothetical protein